MFIKFYRTRLRIEKSNSRRLSCFALFRRWLSDGDGPEEPVVCVDDPLPGDGGGVDVQVRELLLLFLCKLGRIGSGDAKLLQPTNLSKWKFC